MKMTRMIFNIPNQIFKLIKFFVPVFAYSLLFLAIAAVAFVGGFVTRPQLYNSIPKEIRTLTGIEQSHTEKFPLFANHPHKLTVGVFDGAIAQIDQNDIKSLLRNDLMYVISIEFDSIYYDYAGYTTHYTTIKSLDKPKHNSHTEITEFGSITVIDFIFPIDSENARFVTITLINADNYKVTIYKKDKPSQVPSNDGTDDEF